MDHTTAAPFRVLFEITELAGRKPQGQVLVQDRENSKWGGGGGWRALLVKHENNLLHTAPSSADEELDPPLQVPRWDREVTRHLNPFYHCKNGPTLITCSFFTPKRGSSCTGVKGSYDMTVGRG